MFKPTNRPRCLCGGIILRATSVCTTCGRVTIVPEEDEKMAEKEGDEPISAGAAARDPVPVSVWQGSFTVFGVELHCHVLSDGRRIIEADSIRAMVKAMGEDGAEAGDLTAFARWRMGE